MDKICDELRAFTKSFSSADYFNVQIKVKQNNKEHTYVFDTNLGELTQTVFQKLGQFMNDKEYKVLSVAVQPIFKPWLLKEF